MLDFLVTLAWLAFKVFIALALLWALVIVAYHIRAVRRLNFYESQGVVLYPGCKNFYLGNMWDMVDY